MILLWRQARELRVAASCVSGRHAGATASWNVSTGERSLRAPCYRPLSVMRVLRFVPIVPNSEKGRVEQTVWRQCWQVIR